MLPSSGVAWSAPGGTNTSWCWACWRWCRASAAHATRHPPRPRESPSTPPRPGTKDDHDAHRKAFPDDVHGCEAEDVPQNADRYDDASTRFRGWPRDMWEVGQIGVAPTFRSAFCGCAGLKPGATKPKSATTDMWESFVNCGASC